MASQKLMALVVLTMLILLPASSAEVTELEKYLDCLTDKKVDIVFVFDTTGSMEGEINELSAIARNFASDLEASRINYRLGLVEFRDFPMTCGEKTKISCGNPGDFPYKVKDNGTLTAEINTFGSWLKELKAGGGGTGGPEAVLAALRHAVSNCQWRSDAEKMIILLTDAGPHPDGSCCNAEGDTLDGTIFGLTEEAARVYVIGPDDPALKKIAGDTGGQFYKIRSGLSLKPLLKDISGAMSCSFRVDVETSCENRVLKAKVQLVGKEAIPYVAGQTEAWMYLDQAGNRSRYNLSYDRDERAYLGEVLDVCGPVDLTVYGRVGERSAVQTVQVDCGTCGAVAGAMQGALSISGRVFDDSNRDGVKGTDETGLEGWDVLLERPDGNSATVKTDRKGYYIFTGLLPGIYGLGAVAQGNWTVTAPAEGIKAVELVDAHESEVDFGFKSRSTQNNAPPVINNLTSDKASPQDAGAVITWTANASDPDGDQLIYRFLLNELPVMDWTEVNSWAWTSNDTGNYEVKVQVRDGKHAGPKGLDDQRSERFEIIEPMPPEVENASREEDPLIAVLGTLWTIQNSVSFSPDGRTLATAGGFDDEVKLWDVSSGSLIRTLESYDGIVDSVAFSPNGRTLATASCIDDTVKLWDVESGSLIRTMEGHTNGVNSVAFSPDGITLASGGGDNTVRLWDVESGSLIRTMEGHTTNVNSVAFGPDGHILASGSDTGVKLWDVSSGSLIRTIVESFALEASVAFSPDGRTLASGNWDGTIRLWDVSSGSLIRTTEDRSSNVNSVAFSPDGRTLASGSGDATVKLWDVSSKSLIRTMEDHSRDVNSVSFSPDGLTLASGSDDDTVKLWNVSSGSLIRTMEDHSRDVNSVSFSPNGLMLASSEYYGTIKLWNVSNGSLIRTIDTGSDVESIAFSPDGLTLASGGGDNTVKLWDISSGSLISTLEGHTDLVIRVAFSPDGYTLASDSFDDTVKLWDVSSGSLIRTLEGHSLGNGVAFSPDGRTLAFSDDNAIKLWDVESGSLIRTMEGHTNGVDSVAFSPDGRILASGSYDGTIRLWRAA